MLSRAALELLERPGTVHHYGDIDAAMPECGRILTTPAHYAYLKIAEGCSNRCAYCVIPQLRGKYRSRQMADVLQEAENLAQQGVRELIVVAQDTTLYGVDLPPHRKLLPELLTKLCTIDDPTGCGCITCTRGHDGRAHRDLCPGEEADALF